MLKSQTWLYFHIIKWDVLLPIICLRKLNFLRFDYICGWIRKHVSLTSLQSVSLKYARTVVIINKYYVYLNWRLLIDVVFSLYAAIRCLFLNYVHTHVVNQVFRVCAMKLRSVPMKHVSTREMSLVPPYSPQGLSGLHECLQVRMPVGQTEACLGLSVHFISTCWFADVLFW